MAHHVRRGMARAHLSVTAGALGVLAAVGFFKVGPQQVDAERAATKGISGRSIADGSVKLKDLDRESIGKALYFKQQADRLFLKLETAAAKYLKIDDAAEKYLKISDADSKYLKVTDADSKYLKAEALSDYIKAADADSKYLKADSLSSYIKLTDADSKYLKITDADSKYLKLTDADSKYLKLTDADSKYLKITDADGKFLKIDDADAKYVKLAALSDYIKLTDADSKYLKLADAASKYLKIEDADSKYVKLGALSDYIKAADADARYVAGQGVVRTGSVEIPAPGELYGLMEIPGVVRVQGYMDDGTSETRVRLSNLSPNVLEFGSTGADNHGQIDSPGFVDMLVKEVPTTLQLVMHAEGSAVHTLTFSGYFDVGRRVVAQALSGPAR